MRIALIKSSSMGDVIHALPVVSDLVAARPGIEIDWVVEEAFADLPRLHPAVAQIHPVAVRRWRRTPLAASVRAEVGAVADRLRARRYDLALDLQGLIKSAWLARLCGAPVAGFAWGSAREPLATLAYARRHPVPHDLHAIERLRRLAGLALGYAPQGLPVFGLSVPPRPLAWCPARPYAVLLQATSRPAKQWPAPNWIAVAQALLARGVSVVMPWGSAAEQAQAQAVAEAVAEAVGQARKPATGQGGEPGVGPGLQHKAAQMVVAPRLTLAECAALLAGARAVVGVDTGLTHLAAALSVPTVALFAATPGWRFGPYWSDCATALGEAGVWPSPPQVLQTLARLAGEPGWASA